MYICVLNKYIAVIDSIYSVCKKYKKDDDEITWRRNGRLFCLLALSCDNCGALRPRPVQCSDGQFTTVQHYFTD